MGFFCPKASENPHKGSPFLSWQILTQCVYNLEETDGPSQWLYKPRFFRKWTKNQKKQKYGLFGFFDAHSP